MWTPSRCVVGMIVGIAPWGRLLLLGKTAPLSPVYAALKVSTCSNGSYWHGILCRQALCSHGDT